MSSMSQVTIPQEGCLTADLLGHVFFSCSLFRGRQVAQAY